MLFSAIKSGRRREKSARYMGGPSFSQALPLKDINLFVGGIYVEPVCIAVVVFGVKPLF